MKLHVALLVIWIISPLWSAKRKYDERGNIIQATESSPANATPATIGPGKEEKAAIPAVTEGAQEVASPGEDNAAAEEAAQIANQRNPLTQVYLENAQMHLRSGLTEKALEYLKKSAEAGEDGFSREAKLLALWLKARRGDAGLETEAESLDEKSRSNALLRIADGYAACAREQQKKPECTSEAERIYAYVGELAPRSTEGRLARVRLGLLLLDAGKLEAALPQLTKTLLSETNDPKTGKAAKELPLDRAYYSLGQLYERPWYHRDTHKAVVAYKQVLKYAGSPYQRAARERIAYLEKFGTGFSKP